MEFFTDRDLGRYVLPGILREAGLVVHAHADHFEQREPDEAWLPQTAARGWVVLTNDRKIRSRLLQARAVMTSGARVIALVGGDSKAEDLARNFLNTYAKIEALIKDNPAPWIARLYRPNPVEDIVRGRPGSIKLVLTLDDWEQRSG